MLGAIIGDIIGSVYEWDGIKTKEFPLFSPRCSFTDDTVLTVALADTIMSGTPYVENLKRYYAEYPERGYGSAFHAWASGPSTDPYNSYGNGAAMRISPAGFAYDDIETVLKRAAEFTAVTHDHPEGIKGGQATAAAIFMARRGASKEEIMQFVENRFAYDLCESVDELRPYYCFDETSQGTVPQAIRAFIDSTNFEDAIRNAVSLGGDADTLACITGGIAQAFYGKIPAEIARTALDILDPRLRQTTMEFMCRYCDGAKEGSRGDG